jgi:hypothetical protein
LECPAHKGSILGRKIKIQLAGDSVVVKINRPFYGFFGVFIFLIACWGGWFSLSTGYIAFFRLNDVVIFSWKVGVLIYAVPLLLYFSYFGNYGALKNKFLKVNNKLFGRLGMLAMVGAIISLFFHSM